jgi:impB/mucB/samB family C-terminal domain
MIEGLAKEVQKRMEGVGVNGSRVTLKVKQRKQGANPPPKFLGHGSCHNLSKSLDIGWPTRDWNVISQKGKELLALLKVATDDIRGMGIILSKLDTKDKQSANNGATSSSIMKFFVARKNGSDVIPSKAACEDEDDEIDERREDQRDAHLSPASPNLIQEDDDRPEIDESELGGDRWRSRSVAIETEDGSPEEPDGAEERVEDLDNDVASTSEQSFCEVALPPISQLHFSQVDLLPSPLKKQIHAKIALRKPPDAPQLAKGWKTESNGNGRLRQVDLKRMMRLQEWKNANAGMSELKNLPIKTQLQLANDDDLPLGKRDSTKRKNNSRSSLKTQANPRVHTISKEKPSLHCNVGGAASAKASSSESIAPKDCAPNLREAEGEKTGDNEIGSEEAVAASFYCDNVAPAAAFMDMNPEAQGEALKSVAEFLCVCVREGRLHDAVLVLRNIQNRDDSWGKVAFSHLFRCVDDACEHAEGYRLDSQGLGFA